MAASGQKGTVTPVESLFSAKDAHRAARRVEDSIAGHRRELARLRGFVSDNSELINLVQKLPKETSHEIMVPFGGAAFFPGRLIHTNELLVFLGEGYYAERSMEQTVEILQRRGKGLEAQSDSLKAMLLDLEAEARFFNVTASEAAEGLVEIREEYVEPVEEDSLLGASDSKTPSTSANDSKISVEDDEYARVMAKLDELEKEEIANGDFGSEEELAEQKEEIVETVYSHKEDKSENDFSFPSAWHYHKEEDEFSQNLGPQQISSAEDPYGSSTERTRDHFTGQPLRYASTKMPTKDSSEGQMEQSQTSSGLSISNDKLNQPFSPVIEISSADSGDTGVSISERDSNSLQGFTGMVIEHGDGLPLGQRVSNTTINPDQTSDSTPRKPVSRFKLQREGKA